MLAKNEWTGIDFSGLDRPTETEKTNRALYADVQFGQPSMRCRGAGICRVDLYRGINNGRDDCARAIAIIERRQEKVHLLFSRYAVCRHLAEAYFEKGKIRLHEPVKLSEALCGKLGLTDFELPIGVFAVEKNGAFYSIAFPVLPTERLEWRLPQGVARIS